MFSFITHITHHTHTYTHIHGCTRSFIHLARTKAPPHTLFIHSLISCICLALFLSVLLSFIQLVHSTNTNHTDTNSEFYRFVFSFMVFAHFFLLFLLLLQFYFVLYCTVMFCSVCFSVFFKVFGVMEFFVVVVLCRYVAWAYLLFAHLSLFHALSIFLSSSTWLISHFMPQIHTLTYIFAVVVVVCIVYSILCMSYAFFKCLFSVLTLTVSPSLSLSLSRITSFLCILKSEINFCYCFSSLCFSFFVCLHICRKSFFQRTRDHLDSASLVVRIIRVYHLVHMNRAFSYHM